jgi:hypothetical protein
MAVAVLTKDDSRSLRRALLASLGLHVLVASFLPVWTAPQSENAPVEALSFARLMRIEIQRPRAAAAPAAVPQTDRRAAKVSFARHKSDLTAHTRKPHAEPTAVNGPVGKIAAAPRRIALSKPAPVYARVPASAAPIAPVNNGSSQTPQPQATLDQRSVAGTGASDNGGELPLFADQPAVLDPSARAKLRQMNVHVTLTVTVSEDGRTEDVSFSPPLDPQIQEQIRSILAAANWDAAVCGGGVSCQSTATIKL